MLTSVRGRWACEVTITPARYNHRMLAAHILPLLVLAQIAELADGPSAPLAPGSSTLAAVAEAERLLENAADDRPSYDAALSLYDAALQGGGPASLHARRSKAMLRRGDLEKDDAARLAWFEKGVAAADAGIARDPRCADCWFWRSANRGRWGQVRGVMQSLFLLDEVKGGFEKVLALDPDHQDARLSLGLVDQNVPGFAGGSVERAETAFRAVIKASPRFTRARLDLAVLCWDIDKRDEAKALARAVLAEKSPLHPGEHRKFDRARARLLLASWQ